MGKLIIILFFMLPVLKVSGQVEKDFNYYNTLTYNQYLAENWNDLILTSREALDQGYDSYYIQMRLGIAYYSKGKYIRVGKQFRKALEYNPQSVAANEYMYYKMLYTDREKEAHTYYEIDDEYEPKFVSDIYFEAGMKVSDEKANPRNLRYGLLSLKHDLSTKVSFFHAYQYLERDYISDDVIVFSGSQYGGGTQYGSAQLKTSQSEYYASLNILSGRGFYISPAYHFQRVLFEGFKYSNYILSLGMEKTLGITKLYASGSYSRIDDLNQSQFGVGLTIYPLANQNLYLDNRIIRQKESEEWRSQFKQKLGFRLSKQIWLEGWYAYGDMRYFSEQNAFIVFNSPNIINYRYGGGLTWLIKKSTLYLNVIKEQKEEYETGTPFSYLDFIIGLNIKL